MDNENKKKETVKKASVKKAPAKRTTSTKKDATSKSVAKKATTTKRAVKKDIKPVEEVKTTLNETVEVPKEEVKEIVSINTNEVECVYCHKKFERGYTICPHCHKRQKNSVGIIFFIVLAVAFLFAILVFHFIEKKFNNTNNVEEYKASCVLVDYESLVRHAKDYKDKDIRVIGEVVDISGYDDGVGNVMEITINANQFENGREQLITVEYTDSDYDNGFLIGDIITIYGKYTNINGSTPNIEAKYVVFGK